MRAAHPGRVLLEMAQAGEGLAGVEQDRAALHRRDVLARHRRDAREVLHCVERAPLGGEQRAGIAAKAHQVAAGGDLGPFRRHDLDLDRRIERAEERRGGGQPRHHDRVAAVHDPGKPRFGRDHALGGDVMAAAGEAHAQVFGERFPDEAVEIETGQIPSQTHLRSC